MITMSFLDLIHLLVTSGLVVLIWMIQILHYPSFKFYEEENFSKSMLSHQNRITYIVLPLMVAELGITIIQVYTRSSLVNLINLGLVALLWMCTFFIQVPLHKQLTFKKNETQIDKLITTNWWRTIAWSLELLIIFSTSIHTLR